MNNTELKSITRKIMTNNSILAGLGPTIVVFRNTDLETGEYVPDTGENSPDGFFLISHPCGGRDYIINWVIKLRGRSMPNKSYLEKFFTDGVLDESEKFNYIAPCFVEDAWKKGLHFGRPALRQNKKFPVLRSLDEILKNADDYVEYGWPCDNLHGWNRSMGCCAVRGSMGKRGNEWDESQLTSDWAQAYKWIYNQHSNFNKFDVLIFERSDLENPGRMALRFGSSGKRVKDLQEYLGLRPDGIFGFLTLQKVVEYQKINGYKDLGIWEM